MENSDQFFTLAQNKQKCRLIPAHAFLLINRILRRLPQLFQANLNL